MAHELVVKEHFAFREKGTNARIAFNKGDVITDEEEIAAIERGPFARHVMRRAAPPHAPQPAAASEQE